MNRRSPSREGFQSRCGVLWDACDRMGRGDGADGRAGEHGAVAGRTFPAWSSFGSEMT